MLKRHLIPLLLAGLFLATGCNASKKSEQSADQSPSESSAKEVSLAAGDGIPMADIAMKSVSGEQVTIADAAGEKGTLVIFTCNHCPYVQAWQGRLVPLANEYLVQGVGVIAINSNDPKANAVDGMDGMKARANEMGMNYPYVVDETSDIARAFGATRTPEIFLFDGEGKLVYHGAVDDNAQNPEGVEKSYLADALESLIAGEEIGLAETKSVGCSIKFRSKAAEKI
jgi:thioredoxin-related protein